MKTKISLILIAILLISTSLAAASHRPPRPTPEVPMTQHQTGRAEVVTGSVNATTPTLITVASYGSTLQAANNFQLNYFTLEDGARAYQTKALSVPYAFAGPGLRITPLTPAPGYSYIQGNSVAHTILLMWLPGGGWEVIQLSDLGNGWHILP